MQPKTASETVKQNSQLAPAGPNRLPNAIRDGYEIHKAALARGLNVRLLPRQVMEVTLADDSTSTVGFTHGVPQSTTLAGATYAQDLRMRRAMLLKAGFSVPRGATFSVGRSRGLGRKFAERTGFPVVVKPAVGDNTVEVQTGLKNKRQLRQAIEYLYTPPSKRKNFTRSAYALTELREPGRINGEFVAPPGYRFLVEKQVHGQYLRFLVINGEIHNVMYCPDGPWKSRARNMGDVTDVIHSSLKDIAVRAARAVPGLALVALDMVVPDFEVDTSVKDAKIVEFSERPWLSVQFRKSSDLASKMAEEILRTSLPPQVVDLEPQERISAEVLIGGAVDPVALLRVLNEKFSELDIQSELHESDHTLGQIRGRVEGNPAHVAWVFERLLDMGIRKQRAMLVELHPCIAK